MHACVRVCVRATFCVCGSMCGTSLYRPKERPELSVAFEFDPWTSFYNYMTTLGEKKLVRKEFANSLYLSNTFEGHFSFLGILEVHLKVSLRG